MEELTVDIDITYDCNLNCRWCNRLCGTEFNHTDYMTLDQFTEYINILLPHIEASSNIKLLGGEPTLHPQLVDFLALCVEKIRPKLTKPIYLLTNGVGEKVNAALDTVRAAFTTFTHDYTDKYGHRQHINLADPTVMAAQVAIVRSKLVDPSYIAKYFCPITRALQDFEYLNAKFSMDSCRSLKHFGLSITPYGIYFCPMASAIARIYKLGNGFDHFLSEEEIQTQGKLMCTYCWEPCDTVYGMPVSRTYEKAEKEWRKDPYFLPIIELPPREAN